MEDPRPREANSTKGIEETVAGPRIVVEEIGTSVIEEAVGGRGHPAEAKERRLGIIFERRRNESHAKDMSHAHLDALQGVEFGADIKEEIESLAALALILAGVKVNDIFDASAAAVDDPVMAIKGLGISHQVVDACSGRQSGGIASEGDEFGASATVMELVSNVM